MKPRADHHLQPDERPWRWLVTACGVLMLLLCLACIGLTKAIAQDTERPTRVRYHRAALSPATGLTLPKTLAQVLSIEPIRVAVHPVPECIARADAARFPASIIHAEASPFLAWLVTAGGSVPGKTFSVVSCFIVGAQGGQITFRAWSPALPTLEAKQLSIPIGPLKPAQILDWEAVHDILQAVEQFHVEPSHGCPAAVSGIEAALERLRANVARDGYTPENYREAVAIKSRLQSK